MANSPTKFGVSYYNLYRNICGVLNSKMVYVTLTCPFLGWFATGRLGLIKINLCNKFEVSNTHTHTCLTALCPGLPGSAGTRKVKPIWILLEQEIVSASGISWACASLHLAPDR